MGEEQARRQASTDHRQEFEEMTEGNGWWARPRREHANYTVYMSKCSLAKISKDVAGPQLNNRAKQKTRWRKVSGRAAN